MPEGDTVFRAARALSDALAGQVLTGADLRVPSLATVDLTGWTVTGVVSRGKRLLLRLRADDGRTVTLHSHLRMDGRWRVFAEGERWGGGPAHLIRAVLRAPGVCAVGYHLHDLALAPTAREAELVGALGPDLLGDDWDAAEATRRLVAAGLTPAWAALLDQRRLAGIGNVYQAELLFLRGVWPWTPIGDVPDPAGLVALAHTLLRANAGRATRSTTGSLRRGETTYVYGRAGRPCRRCGVTIRRDDEGERVCYWCPHCQPAP
ncbi:DNA-formamidopyrimidine glycosylase family protein [Pilimelia columellifera]|uniref:DNA-formamidopyrimidine glycosylase family protein n=1 Tax=Pilimelia columellifera TaxID=706574 RepID=UPI0031DA68B6